MRFTATEAGFKRGIGGASNSKNEKKCHYILFGLQEDTQHPENSSVYFEYDDQRNGRLNSVEAVSIGDKSIIFELKGGKSIEIRCDVSARQWEKLKAGIRTVFPPKSVLFSRTRRCVRHQ